MKNATSNFTVFAVVAALLTGLAASALPAFAQSEVDLADAVMAADIRTVDRLLASGADPDKAAEDYGQSPLELACAEISFVLGRIESGFGNDEEDRAKIADNRKIINALLAAGADPDADTFRRNQSPIGGPTPMMAGKFAPDCVEPLLAAGADPNARMVDDGSSVLENGIRDGIWSPDRLVGFALVLQAGADAHVKSEDDASLKWVLTEEFEKAANSMSYSAGDLRLENAEPFKYMLFAHEMLGAAGVSDFGADSVLKIKSMDLLLGIGVKVGGVRANLEDLGAAMSGLETLTGRWAAYADLDAPGFRDEMLSDKMPVRRVLRNFTGL